MFKTVRAQHGAGDVAAELEYTILPQSDDRSPSASSGDDEPPPCAADHHRNQHHNHQHHGHQHGQQHQDSGHEYRHQYHQHRQQHRQHHHRRSSADGGTRRTVLIIIAVLVLGCGVVAAAVLVPILLAARLVSSVPTSARLQTFAVAASGVIHSARGDYVQLLPVRHAPPGTVIEFEPTTLHRRLPVPASTNRRTKRSADAMTAAATTSPGKQLRRPVGDSRHRFRTGPATAGFRLLDFRIRQ